MNNKISLTYENGEFNIYINENIVYTDKEIETAFIKFETTIENSSIVKSDSWENIENSLKGINVEGLEINSDFKSVTCGKMKYFYNTDKLFYLENDSMISLNGGFNLFNFIINKINEKELSDETSILELCKVSMINGAIFSIEEDSIIISNPKFSYGTVGFNFSTKKINKGTAREKGSFEEFKEYVLDIFK